jgi:structural maintenance of chromosome 1
LSHFPPIFYVDLKKQRESLTFQIDELVKKKRRAGQDEHLMGQIQAYEVQLSTLKDDLSAANQGIESCISELNNVETSRNDLESDYQKSCTSLLKLQQEVDRLDKVIEKAENQVFADFCKKIKISSIREYEESALSATREFSEKALEYSTAKAKLESL